MTRPAALLWCDLESSGLDFQLDDILEVAFILTDQNLVEMDRYVSLLQGTAAGFARMRANDIVSKMHEKSGLAEALCDPAAMLLSPREVELDLIEMIRDHQLVGKDLHLAGSGVAAFDRPMINVKMPDLASFLHYRPFDVSTVKMGYAWWAQDLTGDHLVKPHRALADVAGHLNEARAWKNSVESIADLETDIDNLVELAERSWERAA